MTKNIKIIVDEKEYNLTLKFTMKAGRLYQSEFNRDLAKDLYSLYSYKDNKNLEGSLIKSMKAEMFKGVNISKLQNNDEDETNKFIAKLINNVDLDDINRPVFYGDEQSEMALKILYVFSKVAGKADNFPEFQTMFEELPLDGLMPKIWEIFLYYFR